MELMVGMFVFTLLSIGVTTAVIQVRRLAQINMMRTAATTVAQGYVEQIMSMNSSDVEAASEFWVTGRPPLPTESTNSTTTNASAVETSDPLYVSPLGTAPAGSGMIPRTDKPGDMWNVKHVMIDMYNNKAGTPTPVNMTMYFDVNISRNWQQVGGNYQAPTSPYMLIQIDYQFQATTYQSVWFNGTVRMARTDISGP